MGRDERQPIAAIRLETFGKRRMVKRRSQRGYELPLKIAYSDLSTWHPKRLGVTATGVLTWRRHAKRRGLVSSRDVTPMDPQELTRVR